MRGDRPGQGDHRARPGGHARQRASGRGARPAGPVSGDPGVTQTVLVVDDDELVAQAAAIYLGDAGFATRTVSSGQAALLELAEASVDVVLMDIRMPGIDGVEALRRLRKAGHAMPVVMMTHDNRPEIVRDVMATGGNGYILKPFEAADLVARVRKALDAAKLAPR
ncbi:MAG: response regulator [Brevundimonas sp.]|nr:MAG: response regulator [Brevundimonas sp.]